MYQAAATIAQTIQSIQHDPLDGLLEIIIVDDGCTDDGPRLVAEAAAFDARIRIVRQSNKGLAAARNTGIVHARGRWLRFLDADDLAIPHSSQRLIDHAQRTGFAAACGPHELIAESGESLNRICPTRPGPDGVVTLIELLTGNSFGVGTLVIRADALGNDRFNENLRVCEDWDLWIRLTRRGLRVISCPGEPVKRYRVRRASLSKDFPGMLHTAAQIMRATFQHARESANTILDVSPQREAAALHTLAFDWAAMRALADAPGNLAEAESMLADLPPRTIDAPQAAAAIFWATLLGLGERPESLGPKTAWHHRTRDWWNHCIHQGRMTSEVAQSAWTHLAALLPTTNEVAQACIDAAQTPKGLIIIGAGQHGHALAHLAQQRHIPYEFRDDAPTRTSSPTKPISAPIPKDWRTIVSPLNDEAILARLTATSPIRWRTTRDQLATTYSAALLGSSPPRHSALRTPHSLPGPWAHPDISLAVIVPLYNSAPTIAETIRSVQTQNVLGLRILVINDGSTDTGPAIVEQLAQQDPRIILISQPNRGLAGARNTGIEAALTLNATHLHFLDADDRMSPGAYEALLNASHQTGAAYGGYALINEFGAPLNRESPISAPLVGLDEELEWNRAATHARLLSAAALGADRFNEKLPVCEDYDLWLRLESRGIQFKAVEQIVCDYRLRPTSLSKKFADMCRVYQEVTRQAFHAARPTWSNRIDLSDTRFRRVVGHSALMYATMDALLAPTTNKDRATALLNSAAHPDRFSPADLAQAACTAILFGSCAAPVIDGHSELSWLPALINWWHRCESESLCSPGDPDRAIEELARKVVHPDDIAMALLNAAAIASPMPLGLIIIGLDRNSRRLARLAATRGTRTLIFDSQTPAAEAALLESHPLIELLRVPEAFASTIQQSYPRARCITGLAGASAQTTINQAARAANINPAHIDTWSTHRDRLGVSNLVHVQRALTPRASRTTLQASPA
jgi:glycosyltransferase involved in cell wall biosynthesis